MRSAVIRCLLNKTLPSIHTLEAAMTTHSGPDGSPHGCGMGSWAFVTSRGAVGRWWMSAEGSEQFLLPIRVRMVPVPHVGYILKEKYLKKGGKLVLGRIPEEQGPKGAGSGYGQDTLCTYMKLSMS